MKETGLRLNTTIQCISLKKQFKDYYSNQTVYFAVGNPQWPTRPASAETGNRTVVANYVATVSADLATMARRSGLDTLGYLLEMVRLEAESETRLSDRKNGGRS